MAPRSRWWLWPIGCNPLRPMRKKLALGALLAVVALSAARQVFHARTWQVTGRLIDHAPVGERLLALTFDDGPVPDHLDEVLSVLRAYDAQATFFLVGEEMEAHPAAVA